jgi:hypothetical protein
VISLRIAAVAAAVAMLGVLGEAATLLAQESRTLPAADRVPLHSVVDVSALPPSDAGEAGAVRTGVKPRQLRHPKEPAPGPAIPATVEDAPPPVAPARLSVASAFEGLGNLSDNAPVTGFKAVPSDANLAVGPNHVFQMVNIVGRVSDKLGGTTSTFSLRSFFQMDTGTDESDPSVVYDAATDRWFATYLQSSSTQSSVILAVSTSGDPKGTFCRFRLGAQTSETFLQDFPQLGISDDKVILTYNAFSLTGPTMFFGAGYYAINKADLVTVGGCPTSVRRVRVPPNLARYGIQPARSISSTGTLYMATNDFLAPEQNSVVVIGVNGVPGMGLVSEDTFTVTVRRWQSPPDADQPGSSVKLNTNDESVITAVWQNGALWIGGNERCMPGGDATPRSCLRLVQIRTDTRSLQQDITFGSAGRYFYYPALSPDGAGNLVVVFNASSATEPAGVRATGRLVSDPPNSLVPSILLRGGGGAQTNSGRMGDFYGAAMDPADPSQVWVIAEYIRATGSGDWGTAVAQLTFGPPPTLGIALNSHAFTTGNALRLDLTVGNPLGPLTADIYLGAVLPPAAGPSFGCPGGDAIAFLDVSSAVAVRCRSASAATFPRFRDGAFIPAGLTTLGSLVSFTWPSTAPAGAYVVFVALAVPGSLDDGAIGPGDVIAIVGDTVTFSP